MSNKISRRTALRIMCTGLAATLLPAAGMSLLTSCDKKTKRIILYFTGTGNSLYIARQLAGDNAELLSIPQLVKEGRYELDADEIGIVYPVYGHMPPYMVREYIGKATFRADYKFAVLTYGNRKCNAVEIWDEITRKAGTPFDYISTIIMVDNWLPNFDMNEQMKIDKHIPENLQSITADISQRRQWHQPVTEEERRQHQGFLERSGIDPETGFLMESSRCFTVTDACIGCGVCTQVCPRGNYDQTPAGIKVAGDCEYCFACIQNCPQRAIRFTRRDDGRFPDGSEMNPSARYRNEHVSLMDIKLANSRI